VEDRPDPGPELDPQGWATRRRQGVRRAAVARRADPVAPRISVLLLDIGGVVIPQLFESVSVPGFPRGPFNGDERYAAVQRGDLSEREYWASVAAERPDLDFGALWRSSSYVREDVRVALAALAGRLRLVGFTNDMAYWFGEDWPRRFPEFRLFDRLLEASKLGPPKPAPEAFLLAAQAIGEPPERCLFVDDLRANLDGAASVGMRTRYFDVRDPSGSLAALLDDVGLAQLPVPPGPRGRTVRVARVPTVGGFGDGAHGR
jgi:FMN phosphatase YigB (HAD superfamily)